MRKSLLALLVLFSMRAGAVCTNSGTVLSATTTVNNIYCTTNDGVITVNATNGWIDLAAANGTGYDYTLTAGPVTRPTQSSPVFNALPTGSYSIKINDCNGSTITVSATIGGTSPAAINISPVIFRSICPSNNGVKVGPAGGRSPYTVNIVSAPAGSGTPVIKGDTIYNLAAGNLNVTITDACGTILGAAITVVTSGPIATSSALVSNVYFGGCDSIYADVHHTGIRTAYLNYALTGIPNNISFVVDSFYTELYFNGLYKQTISPTNINQLALAEFGMTFNGYGNGSYTFKTYSRCSGLIKTDSFIFGNRPATSLGSNTALGGYGQGSATRKGCTDFDFKYTVSFNGGQGAFPLGSVFDVMNPVFKIKIISGPAHVGDSLYATNSYVFTAQFNNLPYSATPYIFEVSDVCGNIDTYYHTQNIPALTPRPAQAPPCDAFLGYNKLTGPTIDLSVQSWGGPSTYPMKYTLLASKGSTTATTIPWTSYPVVIVDSIGNSGYPRLPQVPNPGTIIVAYENACGQKDTTIWTISCPLSRPPDFTWAVTPQCGNRAAITFTRSSTKLESGLYTINGPAGHTLPTDLIGYSTPSPITFINQKAGTYTLKGYAGPSVGAYTGQTLYAPNSTLPSETIALNYPLSATSVSVAYSGPIDTARLRHWDTTFSLIVPNTVLSISATESYLCKDGTTTSNIMAKAISNMPNPAFKYSYSTVSSSGPWSASQTDSLLSITGISGGAPIWVRVTDTCGSTAITNTTVGSLTSVTGSVCNGSGIATITPYPYTNSFFYTLRNVATGVSTIYNYGTPITIDLTNPANAGAYYLSYKLVNAGLTGCVVDSIKLTAYSPCSIVLPLNFLKVSATVQNCTVHLQWSYNSSGTSILKNFVVERSTDGRSYQSVAILKQNIQSYTDLPISGNKWFYRIKAVGIDEEIAYTPTQVVNTNDCNSQQTIVYPNPAKDLLHMVLPFNTGYSGYELYNLLGQLVAKGDLKSGSDNLINTGTLIESTYMLRIIQGADVSMHKVQIGQ